MSRTDAFALLCRCLTPAYSADATDAIRRQIAAGPSWEDFLALADELSVSTALAQAVRDKAVADALPSEVLDFIDGMAELNRLRNAQIHVEALSVARLLNGAGVRPVFLKGAANLLSGLYADPGQRIMLDLDLLVPFDTVLNCAAALRAAGYTELADSGFPAHHHYPAMGRPGDIAAVELHVEPLDLPLRRLLPAEIVLAGAIPRNAEGAEFAVPTPTVRVIHAIAHAQLANNEHLIGRFPLRDLLDVALLARDSGAAPDWHAIGTAFAGEGGGTALDFHRLALARLFDIESDGPRPGLWARALYRRALWQVGHPRMQSLSERALRPWLLLRRSLSGPALRRRLWRNLLDAEWRRRQWRRLVR
ncbi:MAG: nucleotidyltransferase family protein [Alphaproteobacteria bacterium]